MKELSIEEKAKRYDKAIEIINDYYQKIRYSSLSCASNDIEVLEKAFSELKESNDWIPKEIIKYLKEKGDFRSCWISWLEKQVKHANFRNNIQIGEKVTRNEDGVLVNLSQLKRVAKKDEKKEEQKPVNKIKIGKKYKCIASPRYSTFVKDLIYRPEDKFLCSLMNFCSDCFEPVEDDEQKPNKVKPKFKVGDWVVIDGEVLHVKEVTEDGYLTDEGGHIPFRCEKEAMLWTIQDAKDGDVLTTDTWTFIFNKYQDKFVCYHCAASAFNNFSISDTGAFDSNYVHPATKEQRDLLFQKMHEAGYEWDADRKELKKIEQKQVINYPDNLPKDNWELIHEFVNKFGRIPKDEDELNVLIQYVLKRQKPAWSKEDIELLDNTIKFIEDSVAATPPSLRTYSPTLTGKEIPFLKALKDKVQPKQEWSEEDEKILSDIIKDLVHPWNEYIPDRIEDEIKWLKNRLKSLRPQSQWKPSDKQIMALRWVLNHIPYDSHKEEISGLLEQLKKLREE